MKSAYKSVTGVQTIRTWCLKQIGMQGHEQSRTEIDTSAGTTSLVDLRQTPPTPAPTLVLLPGTNMNAGTTLAFAGRLAEERRVVVLDLPGQPGLSGTHRPARTRTRWYGRWLDEVLAKSVPGPVIVVGHSLGGAVALAAGSPQIVGRVLISPAGLSRLRIHPNLLAATLPWLARPSMRHSAGLLRQMSAPSSQPDNALVEWMTLVAHNCRTTLAPGPLPQAVLEQRGQLPCLVVTGRHDVFLPPRVLEPVARRHMKGNLQVIENAGHLLTHERPEEIATLVQEFYTHL